MISLSKLHHFRVLIRSGSYERAARALHLSQSSVSRSVQALESELGVVLLERQRGRAGLRLTGPGQELLRRAELLLDQAAELEGDLSEIGARSQRTLAFGIGPMLASTSLTGPLLDVMSAHPGIEISVVIEENDAMSQRLLDGSIEFLVGPFHRGGGRAGIARRRFGSRPSSVLVRPGHPLADQRAVTAEMIHAFPRISGTAWNDRLQHEGRELAHFLRATVEIDNFELLVNLAQDSDAVLMFSARGDDRELVALDLDFEIAASPEMSVFTLVDHTLSPAAALLVAGLQQAYVRRPDQPAVV